MKNCLHPRRFPVVLSMILLFPAIMLAQPRAAAPQIQTLIQASDELLSTPAPAAGTSLREMRAMVFSALIPGSGQTYLGEYYKGLAFTLGFYGTGLMAVLAHNNFVGREDRIRALLVEYQAAGNFATADNFWQEIQKEKKNRDLDYKKRGIFSAVALAVWAANIIDIVYFSEDAGTTEFSFGGNPEKNFSMEPSAQLFGIKINL